MQPSAGQGAVSAMQDVVILVNCLYDIENVTYNNIKAGGACQEAGENHVQVHENHFKRKQD